MLLPDSEIVIMQKAMLGTFAVCSLAIAAAVNAEEPTFRPPAVPLIVHNPYFSIWSTTDALTDSWPAHWTGAIHALCSMVRVDGQTYRIMGLDPQDKPAMKQVGLQVLPTRTIYDFEAAGVHVCLTFTTPVLPDDLDVLSRPVTYLTWTVRSIDNQSHDVQIYYDNTAELVVTDPNQQVVWSRPEVPGLTVMQIGSHEQPVLQKAGDNLRIDWGYLYTAVPDGEGISTSMSNAATARGTFANDGRLTAGSVTGNPRPANDGFPVAACAFNLGKVDAAPVERHVIVAYDEVYAIEYLGTKLRPYWRLNGMDAAALLQAADRDYDALAKRCAAFDKELTDDLATAGEGYAKLCSLAYRQAIGGHVLAVSPDGRPMLFSKECFSNGCIATVDVLYPAAPIFMWLNNDLLKATVTPVFDYAASDRWKFPFAPHDLGTYPKANGQVYGGGEKTEKDQMPVEECGNMLIVAAVISQIDGNTAYAEKYWPQLSQWATYLKDHGLDPENQLCTDDFAGHLAHNTNLSLKAIMALGAYAKMCAMSGRTDEAAEYRRLAESFAKQWVTMADDGDHFRLAFDKPGTWSQKYNLIWDSILGLNLFPPEVSAKEIAYYKTKLNRFGLPLDNRAGYTKTDWQVWTASLAKSLDDFQTLMAPVYCSVGKTPQRVPLTDWYETEDAKQLHFQARPVIGGVFIKMLCDPAMWKKWSDRAASKEPPFPGNKSVWNGYDRYDFTVDGRDCFVVIPTNPLPNKPWIWRTEFFGHEPQGDVALLGKGCYAVYMDVQNMYGGPEAMKHMDAFYDFLTGKAGLSKKTVLEGFSRGGLFAFNWAARNPDRVACIYVDAPVCDFRSWPGGKGKGQGSPDDWKRCLAVYGLTEAEAMDYKLNPVDNLAPLAKAGIPLLHIVGDADVVVPLDENTAVVEKRYKAMGGPIEVIVKQGVGHHPHSLPDPTPIVDFVMSHIE